MTISNIFSGKRGASIVEVLVAMLVLLVGIMTVVHLFPTGFRVVRAAESRTIASRLANQEVERWKNMSANLPDGILPIDKSGNVINEEPLPPFTGVMNNGELGNALNLRQIYGETTAIPVASYFSTGSGTVYGSRYTLAFSPINLRWKESEDEEGRIFTEPGNVSIRSGDLRRVPGDVDTYPPYLRPGEYAVAYGEPGDQNFYVAFPKDSNAPDYLVSYSYWISNADGELERHVRLNQEISVPSDYAGDWITVPILDSNNDPPSSLVDIDHESETCARKFKYLNAVDWPNDPYVYTVADPILGIIAFNPAGHNTFEYTAQGIQPIKARIDYEIYDPRIIREDKTIPSELVTDPNGNSYVPVKLSLKFILDAGQADNITDGTATDNPDEPTFEGLMRGSPDDPGIPQIGEQITDASQLIISESVMILDLKTGFRVMVPVSGGANPTARPFTEDEVDFTNGIVEIPETVALVDYDGNVVDTVEAKGRHVRFLYRADGDWTIQCHKAYSKYNRDWATSFTPSAPPDFRSYGVLDNGPDPDFQPVTLVFAPCEAEKTVAIDYSYNIIYEDGTKEQRKVAGESHQILTDSQDSWHRNNYHIHPIMPANATGGKTVANVELDRIYAVVGTSFKARVLWRDGKRWLHVDADTNLVRDPMN